MQKEGDIEEADPQPEKSRLTVVNRHFFLLSMISAINCHKKTKKTKKGKNKVKKPISQFSSQKKSKNLTSSKPKVAAKAL